MYSFSGTSTDVAFAEGAPGTFVRRQAGENVDWCLTWGSIEEVSSVEGCVCGIEADNSECEDAAFHFPRVFGWTDMT